MTNMENDFVECDYVRSLYPLAVIEQAARDYADICTISIKPDDTVTRCRFSASKAPLQLTMHEFSNYLIELINERGKS